MSSAEVSLVEACSGQRLFIERQTRVTFRATSGRRHAHTEQLSAECRRAIHRHYAAELRASCEQAMCVIGRRVFSYRAILIRSLFIVASAIRITAPHSTAHTELYDVALFQFREASVCLRVLFLYVCSHTCSIAALVEHGWEAPCNDCSRDILT